MLREITATGNSLYFVHTDHLGSVSAVTCGNSGGCPGGFGIRAVVGRQYYRPYGGPRGDTVALPTDRAFTGQVRDATGLDYFRARYFSSSLGRFISADSIVPGAGNPQNLNRYAYVGNSPINLVDPTGHFEEGAIITYLLATYKDNWLHYYKTWKANTSWWQMLLTAQAGDVLFGTADASSQFRYQFNGTGHTKLTGYTVLEGQRYDLDVIRSGYIEQIGGGVDLNGSIYKVYSDISWEGIYRPGATNTQDLFPYAKHTPLYSEPLTAEQWAAELPGVIASAALGYYACGQTGGLGCAVGTSVVIWGLFKLTQADRWVQDPLDVEQGDLHVQVGGYWFNFHKSPPITGRLEFEKMIFD